MSVEKARAHYIGKDGCPRMNCAQAVAAAFQHKLDFPSDLIDHLETCGGGRAPGGECGALYAARMVLRKAHPERVKACEEAFLIAAGSLKCREIRSLRKLSCIGCVETAAGYVDRL